MSNLNRGSTKELALSHLLSSNNVDIAIITESELSEASAAAFSSKGYTTLLPKTSPGSKVRVLALVKTQLATKMNAKLRPDLMSEEGLTVWVEFALPKESLLVGGVYRQWSGTNEKIDLDKIIDQCKAATTSNKNVTVLGDFNLDLHRKHDKNYARRTMLHTWLEGIEEAGLENQETGATWQSHGTFSTAGGKDSRRLACLDHV